MKKIIIPIVIIASTVLAYIYIFVYNKSHPKYEQVKPEFVIGAEKLFSNFTSNVDNDKFLGKFIAVAGTLDSVEETDSTTTLMFVFNEGMFGDEGVRCSMIKPTKGLNSNIKIKLKGLCTGYNGTDVILEYCSIIK